MAVIGEYRFVFVDDTTKGKLNSSLSSTIESEKELSGGTTKTPVSPTGREQLQEYVGIAAKGVGIAAMAISTYQQIRNMVYNKRTTSAIISGNIQAARHLEVRKQNEDLLIKKGTMALDYAIKGAVIGTMSGGGPIGGAVGAAIGVVYGAIMDITRMNNQHREELKRFMSELSEQKYSGYIESRRLVNLSGGAR